ncbi:MAG: cache domain-containing protein [Chloroflexota bacterium]
MNQKTYRLTDLKQNTTANIGFFSIANQLRYGLVLFIIISLLLMSGTLIYFSFIEQQQQVLQLQTERGRSAATEINAYMDDLQRKLGYLARVRGLSDMAPSVQQNLLEALVRHNKAYRMAAILDDKGNITTSASLDDTVRFPENLSEAPLFVNTFKRQEDYFGVVQIDKESELPFVDLAVPIRDDQEVVSGVLLTRVDLNFLWFIVSQIDVGQTGYAYILDNRNFLIAEQGRVPEGFQLADISDQSFLQKLASQNDNGRVDYAGLDGLGVLFGLLTNLPHEADPAYMGLHSVQVLGASAPTENTSWKVIVELPTTEAYSSIQRLVILTVSILVFLIVLALVGGFFLVQEIVHPLQKLTSVTGQIGAGNMSFDLRLNPRNEMGLLGSTFNSMAAQTQYLIQGLEERGERLETVVTLNERLSAILDIDQLFNELGEQIKNLFAGQDVRIFLLDDQQDLNLVNQTDSHLNGQDTFSDISEAALHTAHTGEIVSIKVQEDWTEQLKNAPITHDYKVVAVPIVATGQDQVFGVIEVQRSGEASLDENDIILLRTLANQVATAVRNARLFEQVEQDLVQAQMIQDRYVTEAWDRSTLKEFRLGQKTFSNDDAAPLQDDLINKVGHQGQYLEKPALVQVVQDEDDERSEKQVLVAPVSLGTVGIGNLQFHANDMDRVWSDDELALIEAIADQLAQSAETLRLFEQTRERASRERLIGEVSDKLRQTNNMESLMEVGLTELTSILGMDRGFVHFGSAGELDKRISNQAALNRGSEEVAETQNSNPNQRDSILTSSDNEPIHTENGNDS